MKSLFAFIKKEGMESFRTGRMLIFLILFFLFGIMNPAIAKLTPWIMEMMQDSLADTGMVITEIRVNALTSWTQFFKNIPMALITFLLLYHGAFLKEYQTGTLLLLLTKGLSRPKVLLAKSALLAALWTIGYWLCFGITYGYNQHFWGNDTALYLPQAGACWWLFGIWTICLLVLFSVLSNSASGVLLGTGGFVLLAYLTGLFPKIGEFTPTLLMNGSSLLTGAETPDSYLKAAAVTVLLCAVGFGAAIPLFNKKQL